MTQASSAASASGSVRWLNSNPDSCSLTGTARWPVEHLVGELAQHDVQRETRDDPGVGRRSARPSSLVNSSFVTG